VGRERVKRGTARITKMDSSSEYYLRGYLRGVSGSNTGPAVTSNLGGTYKFGFEDGEADRMKMNETEREKIKRFVKDELGYHY
jgi:hypothetical protein